MTFNLLYGNDPDNPFHNRQIIGLLDPLQLPPCPATDHLCPDKPIRLMETDYPYNAPIFAQLFNKENIIHLTQNMRCDNDEWNKLLYHGRMGFKLSNDNDKYICKEIVNKRRFLQQDIEPGGHLYETYKKSLKVTYKNNDVKQINNKELELLQNIPGSQFHIFNINIHLSKVKFREIYSSQIDNPDTFYDNLIKSMHNLNGYNVIWNEDKSSSTEFIAINEGRVMLRTNQFKGLNTGSLGTITGFTDEYIIVKFDNLESETKITKIIFEHPDYSCIKIDAIPLIPAWAITIHKLQGQTIDSPYFILYNEPYCGNSIFYTALSRTTKQENVYIISNRIIGECDLKIDNICWEWYKKKCL